MSEKRFSFHMHPPFQTEDSTASMLLSSSIPTWPSQRIDRTEHVIGVLHGEGIGPEVINATLGILEVVNGHVSENFSILFGGKIGFHAAKESGNVLSDEVVSFCENIFSQQGAVLCGPGGGRFVYELRARFDLFCKFTPIRPSKALMNIGVVTPHARSNVDIVMVRENISGAYFGKWGSKIDEDGVTAFHYTEYRHDQVKRILDVAINLAAARQGRLSLALKPGGVPAISTLWEQTLSQLNMGHRVNATVLEVDNAAYQLIAAARDFDVVVSPNMLGDILADSSSLLLGSRGMSYSGNFGVDGRAVYQTAHGAAYDIAGTDSANPIGQILSLAMMLRESFAMPGIAKAIENAIESTLKSGWRTPDIAASDSRMLGTQEMGRRIAAALEEQLSDANKRYETRSSAC